LADDDDDDDDDDVDDDDAFERSTFSATVSHLFTTLN